LPAEIHQLRKGHVKQLTDRPGHAQVQTGEWLSGVVQAVQALDVDALIVLLQATIVCAGTGSGSVE
jgi:hypothetical protein